jgi:serine/threonine protein kinase
MLQLDPNDANQKTDIFALGSTIYFIMKSHPPFPDLDSWKDKLEIANRFKTLQLPTLDNVLGGDVVEKCWAAEYKSANEVVHNLEKVTLNLLRYPEFLADLTTKLLRSILSLVIINNPDPARLSPRVHAL